MNQTNIWMPLYIGDEMARTTRLSNEELGAYLRLQWYAWQNGLTIPADDRSLAAITHVPSTDLARAKHMLAPLFRIDGEQWHDDHLVPIKARAEAMRQRASAGGKALAAKRAAKHMLSTAQAPAKHLRSTCEAPAKDVLSTCTLTSTLTSPLTTTTTAKTLASAGAAAPPSAKNAEGSPEPAVPDELFLTAGGPDSGLLKPAITAEEKNAVVRQVFDYYLTTMGRNGKLYTFTDLRRTKGRARLEEALQKTHGDLARAAELMLIAIDELARSPFHMGENDRQRSYIDWDQHLFHSREMFEKWLQSNAEATHA